MEIALHRSFLKDLKKMPLRLREHFIERKKLFCTDPFHPMLNNHSLGGAYEGYRSINVNGDVRALYYVHKDVCIFVRIGTHHQLYE